MLERWLAEQDVERVSDVLEVQLVTEGEPLEEDALYGYLGQELLRNYVVPGELAAVFSDLGVPEVADHLVKHKFPSVERIRNGDFGEALTGALFRRMQRWRVPILKLRYKQRPNQPVQGADLLGFRLRVSPPLVAVPEVKTRTTKRLDVAVDASMSLKQVLDDLPSSVLFVVARLLEQGNALAFRIARLLDDGFTVERHVVLVHDNDKWDDRITARLVTPEDEPTKLTVVRLTNLKDVITKAFTAATLAPGPPGPAQGEHSRCLIPAPQSGDSDGRPSRGMGGLHGVRSCVRRLSSIRSDIPTPACRTSLSMPSISRASTTLCASPS
ncbi:MAG: hypothetical protein H0U16_08745 [Actinobacteria bacterium]|nr:hypothetical protein [Actinomycetota bacterium]